MTSLRLRTSLFLSLSLGGLIACSKAQPDTPPDKDVPLEPGRPVTLSLGPQAEADKTALDQALAEVEHLDAAGFLERARLSFEELPYDPLEAIGLDLIQGSTSRLDEAELEKLAEHGFVISTRQEFPTFSYGYASIYADDLPLFVSADSILYALHRSYDELLKALEQDSLLPQLERLVDGMRARLAENTSRATFKQDLDVFLGVGASLLSGRLASPLDASLEGQVRDLFEGCSKAESTKGVVLFGSRRIIDFSQCKPRGHYTDSPELGRYFRAMMWFGRIDFRFIETQEDGSSLFHRRQLEAMLALRELLSAELFEVHQAVDQVITAFVGEHDYMTLPEVDRLLGDLGASRLAELSARSDEELAQAIVRGGYGTQRISSHYMVNGMNSGTLPLSSSFALFGQRYVLDSHVFSNVVFDRAGNGAVKRMMPSPLDAAYAAFGNDQAGLLLAPELERYAYAADLAKMRVIADFEGPVYWSTNLYNSWIGALRALSPSSAREESDSTPLPSVARTEAWGRRLLNTQLASWAELRHDTILYVKQSYTGGIACEFPDAYVEPYPEFFARVEAYAEKTLEVLDALPFRAPSDAAGHFRHFAQVAGTLREMAEHQRTGAPHSAAHLEFINEAVVLDHGCGEASAYGWYPRLFYQTNSADFDPTIADVHTQPTDELGNEVGRVLHVGTGNARLFVTTVETCDGPRAYAGLVSSYHELVTEGFERLDDPTWETRFQKRELPPAPEWVTPILSGKH